MRELVYPNRLEGRTIRLVELLPDDQDKPLQCRLIETPLDDPLTYEALSYVWGDPTVTESICCNGQDMHITTNLAQALRKIRLSGTATDTGNEAELHRPGEHPLSHSTRPLVSPSISVRKLWADAISINQQDVPERNHQVQLMKEIYSNAARVIVWLGSDQDGQASDAIAIIKRVNDYTSAYQMVVEQLREKNAAPSWLKGRAHFPFQLCKSALGSDGFENPWASLRAFFLLPWWSRVWCVQEVYLAQKVILLFGMETIDGNSFTAFTQWYKRESTFETAKGLESKQPKEFNNTAIQNAYSSFNHRSLNGRDLFLVCEDFRNLQATDARDKVYGLLGLWRPTSIDPPTLEANYDKSVPEVYTDVVVQAICTRKDLFILRFVDHDTEYKFENNDLFPSWVPRWDCGNPWQFGWLDKSPVRATRFAAEPPDKKLARSGVLKVQGVLFDRVIWTSDVLESGPTSFYTNAELQKSVVQFYKEATGVEPNTKCHHRISVPELATTLTSGFIKIGNETLDKDVDDPNAWLDIADLDTDTGWEFLDDFRTFMDTETYPGDPKRFQKLLACTGKRLFRTSRGYLGLGRRNVREGDYVTVLDGGRVPHVLRIHPEAFFSYVGDCFVYDIMNEQVYSMFAEEGVMPGVFRLR